MSISSTKNRCFIGIGSNISPRRRYISDAIDMLSRTPGIEVMTCSGCYETDPVGIQTSNMFINAVLEITSELKPLPLLKCLLDIEATLGRDRSNGPDRTIDLDLLWYEDTILSLPDLELPHPRVAERAFVLIPWADIAPDLYISPWNKTIKDLLETLTDRHTVIPVSHGSTDINLTLQAGQK